MLAEANTSALAPRSISSRSEPDAPYLAITLTPVAFSYAAATSSSEPRRLPAACSRTGSAASAMAGSIDRARARRTRRMPSCPRHIGVREEQLLAVDLVVLDHLLAGGRDQPVDEGLAELLLDVGMLRRI